MRCVLDHPSQDPPNRCGDSLHTNKPLETAAQLRYTSKTLHVREADAMRRDVRAGRRSTIGNRVCPKRVSGVRIPSSPPDLSREPRPGSLGYGAPLGGASPLRRGGRVVECGGLENRFTGAPGDEGSNPSSSAIFGSDILPYPGPFLSVYAGAGVVANAIRSTEPLFAAALPPIRHYSALCYGVCFC